MNHTTFEMDYFLQVAQISWQQLTTPAIVYKLQLQYCTKAQSHKVTNVTVLNVMVQAGFTAKTTVPLYFLASSPSHV